MDGLEKYYEFSPSDQRLIDVYLRSKITATISCGSTRPRQAVSPPV